MACVLAAKDDAGVRDCYMKGFEQYLQRSKEVEAKLHLGMIEKRAKLYFVTNNEFPRGKSGPTPVTPCCSEQIKKCISDDKMWADPVWQALEFSVEGTFGFQYSYESDGKTFTASAVGDVGCTGTPVTHKIEGKVGADGQPEITKL
jgi:hypothetical protein